MVIGKIMDTLRSRLKYTPRELQFGTSGRRGEIAHLTPLEIYINVTAELEYLRSTGLERGDIHLALDLRPSSPDLFRSVMRAVCDAGMRPVNLGRVPTPALANYAWPRNRASIMVTGSHIPFDRNGYKLNTASGELLKTHEAPIGEFVARVRARLYDQPFAQSIFDEAGEFKEPPASLPVEDGVARQEYLDRYRKFFGHDSLAGA